MSNPYSAELLHQAATPKKPKAPKIKLIPPTPEFKHECRQKIDNVLSSAVKYLFDSPDGGEFFAHLLMGMDVIYDDPRVETAAVSVTNKLNLYVNPYFFVYQFVADLDPKKPSDNLLISARRAAILSHELCHVILHHMSRGADFGNPKLANIAADLVCNSMIKREQLPSGLFPEDYKLLKDQTLDYYYSNFPIEKNPICDHPQNHDKQWQGQSGGQQKCPDCNGTGKKEDKKSKKGKKGDKPGEGEGQPDPNGQPSPGQGEGGEGEGQGEPCPTCNGSGQQNDGDSAIDEEGNCKVCGGVRTFDNHDVWQSDGGDHMSKEMKDSLVKDAVNRAANATKNVGNLPNAIQQAIMIAKKKAELPWNLILRQFISRLANGEMNHTKKRISKRYKTRPGIKIRPVLKLQVGIDVSGSVGQEEYETFINEIFAMSRFIGEIEVIEWDTQIQGKYKIKGYKRNVTRSGCGGTDPREALEYTNSRSQKVDGAIYFSDGHLFGDLNQRSRIPLLWVITADGTTDCVKHHKGTRCIKLPKKAA